MSIGFRARIRVAEDEEFTLNILREVLEGADKQVEAVNTVNETIALLASFSSHLVLTDLSLAAEPSGADLFQFLEKGHPWVGKVVLTSRATFPWDRKVSDISGQMVLTFAASTQSPGVN